MIEVTQGDILRANAEAIVNTVNCVGVMGRGIALQFKKAYPENFALYKAACDNKELQPGMVFVVELPRERFPRYVVNFPTKRHWKGKSRIEDIESGLEALVDKVRKERIESIAVPPLGCGLGGLDWSLVRPMIEEAFEQIPEVRVLLYEPAGAPHAQQMVKTEREPRMTVGRAALLALMRRYLSAVMDTHVSLLEIHKLMYFMQETGEPLRLDFVKGPYGPYAENLRHVLNLMEGHFIYGYGDGEDAPTRQIEIRENASCRAHKFLEEHPATQRRFDRVATLIQGFETPYAMELLASVHWLGKHEGISTSDEAVQEVHAWSDRKRMFAEEHIRAAWDLLNRTHWLDEVAVPRGRA